MHALQVPLQSAVSARQLNDVPLPSQTAHVPVHNPSTAAQLKPPPEATQASQLPVQAVYNAWHENAVPPPAQTAQLPWQALVPAQLNRSPSPAHWAQSPVHLLLTGAHTPPPWSQRSQLPSHAVRQQTPSAQ